MKQFENKIVRSEGENGNMFCTRDEKKEVCRRFPQSRQRSPTKKLQLGGIVN